MSKSIDPQLLTEILTLVGGEENILSCGNCMTRLRIRVSDVNAIQPDISQKLAGKVSGVVINGNEVQVIFGVGKAQRAAEGMNNLLGKKDLSAIAAENKSQLKSKQQSSLQQFLANFATIFTPLIPGFIAAGLMLGIATLIGTMMHVAPDAKGTLPDALNFLKVFSKGLFTFLVILVGTTVAVGVLSADWASQSTFEERELVRARKRAEKRAKRRGNK